MEGTETMALCTAELELSDRREVGEHFEDELIDREIMDKFVPR